MKNIYLILFFICSIGFAQGQQYKIPDIDWKDSTQYARFTDIVLNNINVFDLLKYNKLVLTVDSVKNLEEVYA